jgi:replicative DNA helicase
MGSAVFGLEGILIMPQMDLERGKGYMADYLRQKGLSLRRPFHCLNPDHEDKHPSMSYNSRAAQVHCFSCGVTYDIFDLVGVDYGLTDLREQYDKVCELFGIDRPRLTYGAVLNGGAEYTESFVDKAAALEQMRGLAHGDINYFESRGIHKDSCERYGLFQYEGRAFFPVWEGGVCTGWCARSMNDALLPRYKNSTGSLGLWNGDLLVSGSDDGYLYITEGVVDAILLEQIGKRALALCGSQNGGKLLARCRESGNLRWRFVLCGDPDEAGQRMNAFLAEGLRVLGLSVRILAYRRENVDIGRLYLEDRAGLVDLLTEAEQADRQEDSPGAPSAAESLDLFFAEAEKRRARGAVATGFSSLDKLLGGGLYAGLYIIGAISSLGKTSFVLQMADYMASRVTDVLLFSLEQGKWELMAKSMSRIGWMMAEKKTAPTARSLMMADYTSSLEKKLVKAAKDRYAQEARRLFIREGLADIGAEDIRMAVRDHMERTGRAPVVIVDYLQILGPADARATDKQNTDRAVVALKRVSRDFDIPVIAVSSFNRENYRLSVSMEAFKESGAVEYSSDVLMGMQLSGAGEKGFDVNKAKLKYPRRVEIVILKNRNGVPYGKVGYHYYAKYSYFEECT